MRDYRKLEAFQQAHELVLSVYRLTRGFPAEERYGLSNQLRRAAVSITSNIVEGSARNSEAEYRRFLEIAHSSSWEVGYQLCLASDLGYGTRHVSLSGAEQRPLEDASRLADTVSRMLGKMVQHFTPEER